MPDRVLIVGATGLIGGHVVTNFPERTKNCQLVYLGRQGFYGLPGHLDQYIAPITEWARAIEEIKPDILISCLGSTIRKAGSQKAFAAIDRDLVRTVATASRKVGARHCIAVSSTLADSDASSFYLKTKGEAEDALRSCAFDRLDIIRPGLLRGKRTNDPRLGESLAIIASPVTDLLLQGRFRRYRSIDAEKVALAILQLLSRTEPGEFVHENDQIFDLI